MKLLDIAVRHYPGRDNPDKSIVLTRSYGAKFRGRSIYVIGFFQQRDIVVTYYAHWN
jgi:hypothetical protein